MSVKFVDSNNIELLQLGLLQSDRLLHFSTTIKGGVSRDNYASLNLGLYSGDNSNNVTENRRRLAAALDMPIGNFFVPCQTHGDKIRVIDDKFLNLPDDKKQGQLNGIDALITDRKNICIGITTADCVPILIFDPLKNILAAVHAGWKGTVSKIASKTVAKMAGHYKCDRAGLLVGIAPCISQERFEVGEEVTEAFRQAGFPMRDIGYRNLESGKMHIDLRQANKLTLEDAGVLPQHIEIAGLCTYSDPGRFFSARRQTVYSGRMITGGILK